MKKMTREYIDNGMGSVDPNHRFAVIKETENGLMIMGSGMTAEQAQAEAFRVADVAAIEIDLDECEIVEIIEENPNA